MSKSIVRSIKNVTNGYSSSQVKVRNATSNDAWGPSTGEMEDICRLTYGSAEFFQIMDILDKRMNDKGKNWRHVLKSLTVFEYILFSGSEYVVQWGKHNLYIIKTLREFQYVDEEGVDQGASIRAKAKELTEILQNDERLREARSNGRKRRSRRHGNRDRERNRDRRERDDRRRPQRGEDGYDSDIERALEESRMTAEEEERRRRQTEGSDEDLRRAIALSKEEERHKLDSSFNNDSDLFGQPSLIDTDFSVSAQQYEQMQQQYYAQQQQLQQQQQQQQQTDIFGNPIYQQSLSTGVLQNAYATGATYNPVGYQQQQSLYYQPTGYDQQQALYYQQQQQQLQFQQQQQQPLQPLKTGSNNPFAKLNDQPTSSASLNSGPSLSQIQADQQQQQQQQQQQNSLRRRPSRGNFDDQHLEELNNLIQNGTGMDTFGNYGDLRIPAQHTVGNMVNSTGINLADKTGADAQHRANPFLTQQYTGIATTNQIQPAYTGYGFGNAAQSQQTYQGSNGSGNKNSLIDL